MEGKEEVNFGVTVRGDVASESFRVAPRADTPAQSGPPFIVEPAPPVSMVAALTELKKKRGRPRKYGPDGAPAAALSPMPISASIPLTGDFSGWKQPRVGPFKTVKKAHKLEFESLGDKLAYPVDANFTVHAMTVNAGEDVAVKVLSFSQHEPRAICVLSASGSISNVTLQQPTSSGGTLTYEGRFEILSLSGSFIPTENCTMRSRSGGLSISIAGPDGRVLGGGLAGLLVAASPVQVILGSFLPEHQLKQKSKKKRADPAQQPIIPTVVTFVNHPMSETGYGGHNANFTSPRSFPTNNVNSSNLTQDFKDATNKNIPSSSPESESNEDGSPIEGDGPDGSPIEGDGPDGSPIEGYELSGW